jgi:hypothetical protein
MAKHKTPPATSEVVRQAANSQEALLADRSALLLELADELAGDTIGRERLLDLLRNEAAAWTTAAEAIAAGHNAQEVMKVAYTKSNNRLFVRMANGHPTLLEE